MHSVGDWWMATRAQIQIASVSVREKLSMTKREFAEYFGQFIKEYGKEEAAKIASRMLLGLVISSNGSEAVFEDEGVGVVTVKAIPMQQAQQN